MKKAPNAAIAEVKPVMAADSFSAWRKRVAASAPGISRAISLRMMLGIIWKVEALPTPVAKNNTRNMREEAPECARLVLDAEEIENAEHAEHHQARTPRG